MRAPEDLALGAAMRRASPRPLALQAGQPWPMGVHWDGAGINIAVFSANAQAIELCLFDEAGHETHRARLPAQTQDVWHGYLPGVGPGQVYGLRAHGHWRPDRGQRFNPRKLLLDPYARQIVGSFNFGPEHFGFDGLYPLQPDPRDNAATALKCRVVHDAFEWGDDRAPCTPAAETIVYEVHVKGFTRLHPGMPETLRGTYGGLAHDVAINHFKALGITAVNLLPVQHRLSEYRLAEMGLANYWGYNTLGFFCPDPGLAADPAQARDEFRSMVKRLHAAGIEVWLDVVYNHTAEADELGPTLCWRGLDNASWYRLPADQRAGYENPSGCGNALDLRQPRVLQMVLDSLRFWVADMHVDGFRFDLAPVLARGDHGFDRNGPFFKAVLQCPVLGPLLLRGKLVAEPWDIGPGGYQVGNFPRGWLEWNDGFRDTMRGFWLGGPTTRGDFAQRLAGSSDRLQAQRRLPGESVNYVVSHDGFTLRDLVSYDFRHNEANGENNRDGHGHNLSWNCGWEGATDDPEVLWLRGRLQRALLATVLLAQGTPMLAAGDEFGHSQGGNNNPYCQDNATTWIDWSAIDHRLLAFTQRLITLRRQWLPLGPAWYTGLTGPDGLPDLGWLRRHGGALEDWDWHQSGSRVLGALVGAPGRGDSAALLLLFNAEDADVDFDLPASRRGSRGWQVLLDSARDGGRDGADTRKASTGNFSDNPGAASLSLTTSPYPLAARSVVVLASVPTASGAHSTAAGGMSSAADAPSSTAA